MLLSTTITYRKGRSVERPFGLKKNAAGKRETYLRVLKERKEEKKKIGEKENYSLFTIAILQSKY